MGKYYAVRNGHNTGVYSDWSSAKSQVSGYSGNECKSFSTAAEANAYMSGGSTGGTRSGGSSGHSNGGSSHGASSHSGSSSRSSSSRSSHTSSSRPSKSGSSSSGRYSTANSSSSSSKGSSKGSSSRQTQTIYTDGSCINNGKSGAKAGWGAIWGDSRDSYGSISNGTSNAGELHAIKETLTKISSKPGNKDYKIMTDSQYSIDSVNKWGSRWEKNGYKTTSGGNVKNADLVRDVRGLMKDCESRNVKVSIGKVQGHANIPGNEAADRLAKKGARS